MSSKLCWVSIAGKGAAIVDPSLTDCRTAMVVAVSAFLHINTVGGHHAAVVAEIVTAAR